MPEWSAQVEVDERLARRLVREQFPDVEARALRLLATGWDNTVWLVDERWAFRFPRREIGVPLVEREVAVLPHLRPLVPLSVPDLRFVGRPSLSYPWPFLGAEFLPGRELASVSLDTAGETGLAGTLARFLRVLHSDDTLSAVPQHELLPVDPNGRADMTRRAPRAREALARLEEQGLWHAPASFEPLLESALSLSPADGRVLVHGDLHFRHVLVEEARVSGVIDWGDVCLADPCLDLQLVWSFLSPTARAVFLEEYGDVPPERELRARVLGLSICAQLALYGNAEALCDVERAALASLDRLAVD